MRSFAAVRLEPDTTSSFVVSAFRRTMAVVVFAFRRTLLVGLLVAPVLAGCDVQVGDKGVSLDIARGKATEDWTRTYTIRPGGRLEILDINGTINVSAATGNTVQVHALRDARSSSDDAARQLLRRMPMAEQVAPDHVRIEVQPDSNGLQFGRQRLAVTYDVQVPPGLVASFRTQNGTVRLDNVDGRFEAESTNGSITGRDVSGSISATTVNGGIQMGLTKLSGDVTLRVVNGGIRIEVPPSLGAQLDATTVNGGVSVDGGLHLSATENSRRRVTGTMNNGGPRILAETTNGGVRVMARASS